VSTDQVADLPPLRDVIRDLSLTARRSLGQNYLLDLNITRRIARSGGVLEGAHVLEIGPGPGGLTRALLLEGAPHVTVIERDERFLPALEAIQAASSGRLAIELKDALAIDYAAEARARGWTRVIANLPYNIATPLLVGWLTETAWPPWFDKLIVMVQLEVGQRLVAKAGDDAYGRLSVLAQLRARARIAFTLPPRAFTPSPKVSSALVVIDPFARDVDVAAVETVTAAAFGQRRKMLRSSLGALGVDTAQLLETAGIDPTARAETLDVDAFVRLATAWKVLKAETGSR
jgi:16S rRNA (adenine1518-N6/adenine1519-N6)-dimethyltransferase